MWYRLSVGGWGLGGGVGNNGRLTSFPVPKRLVIYIEEKVCFSNKNTCIKTRKYIKMCIVLFNEN